jgi:single-strand DNA-binding protein
MSTSENIGVNVVVLRGSLSSEPVARDLNSGSSVIGLEVTTRHEDEPTRSVPVSIFDPAKPDEVLALTTGDEVLVVGSISRRFFKTAGGTGSRTEVVATDVVPTRQKAKVKKLVTRHLERLGSALE